jgi:GT2 family glycosyltransferase
MMPAFENLAILIPTRNRPEILKTSLQKLKENGFAGTVLWVYDDCSTRPDASQNIRQVVSDWPAGKVIRGEVRVGQAEGRNVLMRACGKEYGLLLDDDSVPVATTALARHLSEAFPTGQAIVTCQYLDVPTQRFSTPPDVPAGPTTMFQGGGSLFHIPTVMTVGGFRKCFIYGYEEPELSMRLRMNNYQIWYDPKLLIEHYHYETPAEQRNDREYDYLYARNSILMSSLNMPLWLGLPHGLARSLRRSLFRRRNAWPKIQGTVAGIWQTFSRWRERTPCTGHQAVEWCRLSKA